MVNKNVTYDFTVESIVSVDAPIGTDPDTLIRSAKIKLIERINENDITLVFDTIFDSETGAYDEDWENYERDVKEVKLRSYYVDLQDGYEVGDLYEHGGKMYEVIRIEAFNQLMEVEEVENSEKI